MKKMLTVMAGIVAAGSLISSIARADVIVGEDESTWSPYSITTVSDESVEMQDMVSTIEYKIAAVGLPNPYTDVKGLKEAEKLTGVKMKAPSKIKGYDEVTYQVIKKDKLIQIFYKQDNDNSIIIKKAVYDKDVSGDYNKYENRKKITVNGNKIALEGKGRTYFLATWKKGEFSYSVGVYNNGNGISLKQMKKIVKQVK